MGNSIPDETQMTTLYQEMYGRMAAYAFCVLGDRNLAQEAVQDAFCLFCTKAEEIPDNPQRQLMQTLQTTMRNMQRYRAAMNRLLMAALQVKDLEELLVYDEGSADLGCNGSDAHADFQLLKRVILDGCTIREAAQEHGITVEACKQRMQRVQTLLREKLSSP